VRYFDGWALSAVKRARDSCAVGTGSDCTVDGISRGGEVGAGSDCTMDEVSRGGGVGVDVSAGFEEIRKWGVVAIARERVGRVNRGMALDAVLRSEQVSMT